MLFNGFPGIIIGVLIFLGCLIVVSRRSPGSSFKFDADNPGDFEKLLAMYIDLGKFLLGLASGSIVLLVGSSALHSTARLPASYASPLFLLTISIFYGILFMAFLLVNYEDHRHHPHADTYKRRRYTRNTALGWSMLGCFVVGYFWLVVIVTA